MDETGTKGRKGMKDKKSRKQRRYLCYFRPRERKNTVESF